MMKKNKKIELLAPCGGMEQFYAAVNCGADAVYLGGIEFNARIGAGNFLLEEIEEACDYAHELGVRVYVTMNTLMMEDEIPKALSYAEKLYTIGVDALIIQDLGLGYVIRERMPDFEIHLSTQASVYNRRGVQAAKKLGYKRVVLARECTLEEIKDCTKDDTEIEVFVHGALCMCYSGQCQLSRYIGGRSGNRGMCAQPCRLTYNGEHLLSPKDLCYIDHIGDLIGAGVSSLKIEGRMKSAQYVATVVRIYRKYIDEYYKKGKYIVSENDRKDLMQIFNRGGFTEGYLLGDPGDKLMSGSIPKNQGIYTGVITGKKNRNLYGEVSLIGDIEMGDVIEIRGDCTDTFSTKVTYLQKHGTRAVIGDLREDFSVDDKVYRIVSKDLMARADKDIQTGIKTKATADLYAYSGTPMKLTLRGCGESVSCELEDFLPEAARSRATIEEEIKAQLVKSGDTRYEMSGVRIHMNEELFIPVSKINELRRNALERLSEKVRSSYKRDLPDENGISANGEFHPTDKDELLEDEKTVILPQITKGYFDNWLEENVERFAEKVKSADGTVLVNNISWIEGLSEKGVNVAGGWGLNITNSWTVKAYSSLGMSEKYMTSAELFTREEMSGIPLMVTEHEMKPGVLTDRKGAKYAVEYNDDEHKTYIFALDE